MWPGVIPSCLWQELFRAAHPAPGLRSSPWQPLSKYHGNPFGNKELYCRIQPSWSKPAEADGSDTWAPGRGRRWGTASMVQGPLPPVPSPCCPSLPRVRDLVGSPHLLAHCSVLSVHPSVQSPCPLANPRPQEPDSLLIGQRGWSEHVQWSSQAVYKGDSMLTGCMQTYVARGKSGLSDLTKVNTGDQSHQPNPSVPCVCYL